MKYTWLLPLSALALVGCGEDKSAAPAGGAAPEAAASAAGGEIVLVTEIPQEKIEHTPQPINLPVEPEAVPSAAPKVSVPAGTVLLSANKPVTSSDADPLIGSLKLVTDGNKDPSEGYFVELFNGAQWLQIDLEQSAQIEAIWMWHFHAQRRVYHDVIVQISDDPTFQSGVTTVFNNDFDNSNKLGLGNGKDKPYIESRFGRVIDVNGVTGRYVRLYSNGNTSSDANHYIEVEVFGLPAAGGATAAK